MPDVIAEVEDLLSSPLDAAGKYARAADIFVRALPTAAVDASEIVAGADEVTAAGIAAGLTGLGAFPEIMLFVCIMLALTLVADVLLALAGKLPTVFGIRGAAVSAVHTFLSPLFDLQNFIMGLVRDLLTLVVDGLVKLLRFLAPYAGLNAQHITTTTVTGTSATVQAEISHIEETNYQQWEAINYLQHQIAVITNAPNTAAISLQDQINTLVDNQTKLRNAIETEARDLVKLDTRLATVEAELSRLQTQLHGVAAVSTTYGNELAQLTAVTTGLENDLATTNTQVSANTHELGQLAPLGILTAAGAAGIKNLQKLEQDPCQCPKFGDISGALGTAIAVYELATNG